MADSPDRLLIELLDKGWYTEAQAWRYVSRVLEPVEEMQKELAAAEAAANRAEIRAFEAEQRVAVLEAGLREWLAETRGDHDRSWTDAASGLRYCATCDHPWPCAASRARALLEGV